MNASLQALVACPPFYNLMRSIPLQPIALRSKTVTPTVDAMVELINEFGHLPPGARLTQHKKSHKKEDVAYDLVSDQPFEPTGIYKLWNSSRPENEGRQEDAEEFLGFVLNKLNDEMLEVGMNFLHMDSDEIVANKKTFFFLFRLSKAEKIG